MSRAAKPKLKLQSKVKRASAKPASAKRASPKLASSVRSLVPNPEAVVLRQADGAIMIVRDDDDKNFYRVSGPIACAAFELFRKGLETSKVTDRLLKQFETAPKARLKADVEAFHKQLVKNKILVKGGVRE